MRQVPDHRSAPRPRLVVSVHDVAPSTADAVRWLLDRLDALGAAPRVLKVIPRERDERALGDDDALVELLRREAATGSEIVVHGYTHLVAGPLRGPLAARWRARLFAGGGAELLTLSPGELAARVAAGRAAIEALGLEARGFCAPGWLATPELPAVLAAAGYRYLLTFGGLRDLRTGRARSIPALGCMGAGPIQERLLGVERELLLAGRRAFPVLRVFLHPAGAPRSASCRRTLRALERLLGERQLVTYRELVGG